MKVSDFFCIGCIVEVIDAKKTHELCFSHQIGLFKSVLTHNLLNMLNEIFMLIRKTLFAISKFIYGEKVFPY